MYIPIPSPSPHLGQPYTALTSMNAEGHLSLHADLPYTPKLSLDFRPIVHELYSRSVNALLVIAAVAASKDGDEGNHNISFANRIVLLIFCGIGLLLSLVVICCIIFDYFKKKWVGRERSITRRWRFFRRRTSSTTSTTSSASQRAPGIPMSRTTAANPVTPRQPISSPRQSRITQKEPQLNKSKSSGRTCPPRNPFVPPPPSPSSSSPSASSSTTSQPGSEADAGPRSGRSAESAAPPHIAISTSHYPRYITISTPGPPQAAASRTSRSQSQTSPSPSSQPARRTSAPTTHAPALPIMITVHSGTARVMAPLPSTREVVPLALDRTSPGHSEEPPPPAYVAEPEPEPVARTGAPGVFGGLWAYFAFR